jgi:hypothetical protein
LWSARASTSAVKPRQSAGKDGWLDHETASQSQE